MSTTILEALQNADFNLGRGTSALGVQLGKIQLHNAVILLEKAYPSSFVMDDLLEQYENLEDVPDFAAPQP